jgi:ribosomal protein L12E/L44/L45/RPP1/RPP2
MNTFTIRVDDIKAKRLIKNLADIKLIEIINESNIDWSSKKITQARSFLKSYNTAKQAEKGKVKLQSAKSLINEL